MPPPDALISTVVEAAALLMTAAWLAADCPEVSDGSNPKAPLPEAVGVLQNAFKAAVCGDGADAAIGYAMVAKSLAKKSIGMRNVSRGPDLGRMIQNFRGPLGG